jgi:hypothetical protein
MMRLLRVVVLLSLACHAPIQTQALKTTVNILQLTQPALNQESDYDFAASAIPGALKTIEGFWIVDPKDTGALVPVLTEGFCQYATAFVEDEWEIAKFAKDEARIAETNEHASKMFTRCFNYALKDLPSGFDKDLFGTPDQAKKRIDSIGIDHRTPFMWAALALGGEINHNLTRVDMLAYLDTVKQMLHHVIDLDTKYPPHDCDASCKVHLALPHIGLGMVASAASAQFGGNADEAAKEFQKALDITGDKMLLARALWGYRVGLMTNNRKLFHDQLVKVLETDGAIWPEQRLANEVAHRRARRYLSHEKDLFQ